MGEKVQAIPTHVSIDSTNNDEVPEYSYSEELESGDLKVMEKTDLTETEGDPVLARKIYLINNAIDEIGFTMYHAKLFCIAGFGYSADSQLEMIQSAVKTFVDYQYGRTFPVATEIFYVGLFCGSIFWGFGADLIGRKLAFNSSLFLAAMFGLITGGMDSYATYCIFMFMNSFCAGGNLGVDVAVFLEYLPNKYHWLNTFLAAWWGLGQTIAVLIGWAFLPNYSCASADDCPSSSNRGWRYCWYLNSGLVLVGAIIRLLFRMDETPKFLVSNGRDEEAVESLRKIAEKYNRPFTLTVEQLQNCGELKFDTDIKKHKYNIKHTLNVIKQHTKILYASGKIGLSSTLIFISWFVIGLAYDVFYNFLYIYIGLHGGNTGTSNYIVYRDSAISNFVGIFGPMLAAAMLFIPKLGRRGTMAFGAVASMAVLFGYTTVRTPAGDAGFGSATYFFVNVYYAVLYAYTPEVLPAQARGTGCAIALASCRVAGAISPVVYYYGQQSGSSVPIWVCGGAVGLLSVISLSLPFEPSNRRSV
ncbi:Piso0_005924 [Millerozyma farinosa CBS 7064]|uniref:Piso0_005924 protein n=1 Tax=Pichia sorbitophila (strain ATCC MYA-4447 / BCRC 22081 / CBS 7064 / NBRC 10061 / NRRL Y-12695) TaxID=559304 RepID=G8Y395_PICSO|nr:Piso0_005924 [Millerozyma farinosa CBS 7064]